MSFGLYPRKARNGLAWKIDRLGVRVLRLTDRWYHTRFFRWVPWLGERIDGLCLRIASQLETRLGL